jgi:hypothetical protein
VALRVVNLVQVRVELVELHARAGRIHLKAEGRGLDELLLLVVQLREAVDEGVGDRKLHRA